MKILFLAFVIDHFIGDPEYRFHPIRIIGYTAQKLTSILKPYKRFGGIICLLILSLFFSSIVSLIEKKLYLSFSFFGLIFKIFMVYSLLALGALRKISFEILKALEEGDVKKARQKLSQMVGRDVERLEEKEIIRGCIESIAENSSDGVIAPCFYYFIGGLPTMMFYKVVNTLDSMYGYKRDWFKDYGWACARLDDLLNFIPARLTALSFIFAGLISGYDWKRGLKTILRDAKKHDSPNAGYPEAAIAGLLGIKLGGTNFYNGICFYKGSLGEKIREFEKRDIKRSTNLMYVSCLFFLVILYLISYIVRINYVT